MTTRLHIGLLFGGLSTEHEVSLLSARNIYQAIDQSKYDVSLIRIDKHGHWHLDASPARLLGATDDADHPDENHPDEDATVLLSPLPDDGQLLHIKDNHSDGPAPLQGRRLDVLFPILHGANGEDGTIQGLLKLVNMPFVGAGVIGSVLGMDKDVMKRLLQHAGLPIPRFQVLRRSQRAEAVFAAIAEDLGLPFFIKPANAGSSVGISKVDTEAAFAEGLDDAFRYDNKVLLEENIDGREIECAVIGNEQPLASITGEIATQHSFYSYEAKYLDEDATTLTIPADIPEAVSERIRDLAVQVYQVLCCEGMARVDVFLDKNGAVLINEINTIPGFTKYSMFPVLWQHTGLPLPDLIDKLIALALERHERDERLKKTR